MDARACASLRTKICSHWICAICKNDNQRPPPQPPSMLLIYTANAVHCTPTTVRWHAYVRKHSADIRDKSAKHWSDESVFANRAYFLFEKQNELAIQNVKDGDSGIYRCRVDFEIGQTKNSKVNLTVIREYRPSVCHDHEQFFFLLCK